MLKRVVLGVIAVGLAVTGCSSSSKSSSSSSSSSGASGTTAAPAATTAAPASSDVAHDKALGEAAILRLSDFPSGWTSTPATTDNSSAAEDQKLATCLGVSVSEINREGPADVKSPDFNEPAGSSGPGNAQVSGGVGYEASADKINSSFKLFAGDKMAPCLNSVLSQVFADAIKKSGGDTSQVTVGNSTVAKFDFPTVGDNTVAYRVTVPISAAGQSLTAYVDFVVATKGRAGFDESFENLGTPFSADLEGTLMRAVEGRLTDT